MRRNSIRLKMIVHSFFSRPRHVLSIVNLLCLDRMKSFVAIDAHGQCIAVGRTDRKDAIRLSTIRTVLHRGDLSLWPHPITNGSSPDSRIFGAITGTLRGLNLVTCSRMWPM